jgi:hypothetical protein
MAYKAITENHKGAEAQFTKSLQLLEKIKSSSSLPTQMIAQIFPVDRFEKIREEYRTFIPKPFNFQSSIVSLEDDINWIIG